MVMMMTVSMMMVMTKMMVWMVTRRERTRDDVGSHGVGDDRDDACGST